MYISIRYTCIYSKQIKSTSVPEKYDRYTGIITITNKSNFEKASVIIEKKDVVLNYDSYTKREKIYNSEGIWIDTKPLNHNNNYTNTK